MWEAPISRRTPLSHATTTVGMWASDLSGEGRVAKDNPRNHADRDSPQSHRQRPTIKARTFVQRQGPAIEGSRLSISDSLCIAAHSTTAGSHILCSILIFMSDRFRANV